MLSDLFLFSEISMDFQLDILRKLVRNQIDWTNLLHYLQVFQVPHNAEAPFVLLKLKLKYKLLKNLLPHVSGAERDVYSRMVLETDRLLTNHGENIADVYKCTLVGCLFETSHHRIYIRHIRRIHPNATNIQCNFGLVCVNTFKSYELLKQHIDCLLYTSPSPRDS